MKWTEDDMDKATRGIIWLLAKSILGWVHYYVTYCAQQEFWPLSSIQEKHEKISADNELLKTMHDWAMKG